MPREHRRHLSKLSSADEQAPKDDAEGRLESIIKTFRENNLRLMQKIEECDRMRQLEHELNQKKLSERHLLEPGVLQPLHLLFPRPRSQFKTERRIDSHHRHHSRKENLATELIKRTPLPKTQNCEINESSAPDDNQPKLVKISLNRLVPLTIDRLKQRITAL